MILRRRRAGKEGEEVACFGSGFLPIRGRRHEQMILQLASLHAQRLLVGLDVGQHAALYRSLLSGQAAVSVEIDSSIGHLVQSTFGSVALNPNKHLG